MAITKKQLALVLAVSLLSPCVTLATDLSVKGDWGHIDFSGWGREYISMNMQNPFPAGNAKTRGQLSMARSSVQIWADGKVGVVGVHAIARLTREIETPYLQRLDNAGAKLDGQLAHDQYSNDRDALRELYFTIPLTWVGRGSELQIGKQQVAFGNTDFFHVLDAVNGFDFTWRTFLVPENEDIRKPLVMANLMINIPKLNGQAQFLMIPGSVNRGEDFGNNYDIFGGRWSNQPYKAVDFINPGGGHPALVPYNYRSQDADTRKVAGGFRWNGRVGGSNYSFVYLHQHNGDPVFNSPSNPYKQQPVGLLGDTIYPFVDIVGVTGNTYAHWADAVFSTEIGYTFDKPYNIGTDPSQCVANIAGLCGITTKNTLQVVVRMDKSLNWTQSALKTFAPAFFSLQAFDTYVPGLKRSDDIVDLVGYTARKSKHTTIVTAILALNYKNNTIQPGLAGGMDVSNGGGFLVPNLTFAPGDHWRVRLEADLFFAKGSNKLGGDSSDTHLFGYFKNNNQLFARIGYQF